MYESDAQSITLHSGSESYRFSWAEIEEVFIVKQDTFNPDIIKLVFVVEGEDYEFMETEIPNFRSLFDVLNENLEDVKPFAESLQKATDPLTRLEEVLVYTR